MSLLMLMISVQVVIHFHLLDYFSQILLNHADNNRQVVQFMTFMAFFSAMFLTNDVAILTLVPLYLGLTKQQPLPIPLPLTLITIAANLGSMATPFGNPQNLYLVANYHWSLLSFGTTSLPISIISLILVLLMTYLVKPIRLQSMKLGTTISIGQQSILLALGLVIINLLGIFSIIPLEFTLMITIIIAGLIDIKSIAKVDYGLLITFVFFFLIVGNLSQNTFLIRKISQLVTSPFKVYLTGMGLSQVISNVPSAILLAKFTNNVPALFLGVNIGGLGTLVASLANLITLKQLMNYRRQDVKAFTKIFLLINVIGLIILGIIGLIILR